MSDLLEFKRMIKKTRELPAEMKDGVVVGEAVGRYKDFLKLVV